MASAVGPGGGLAWPMRVCRRCMARQDRLALWGQLTQRRGYAKNPPSKYEKKGMAAKEQWDIQAKEISEGTRRNVWDILEERGFIKDTAGYGVSLTCTAHCEKSRRCGVLQEMTNTVNRRSSKEDIRELMRTRRIGAYVGIDPTAPSLHLGHLLPLMPLFWMYMYGYQAMSLLGSSTAKIGDPTDRLTSRDKMERARLTSNLAMMHFQLKKLWANIDREAERRGFVKEWAWRRGIVQNGVWWGKVTFPEVMKRLGEGLRIGTMLSRDT
jgi:tyrosyl-tRNA synthetase